MDDLVQSFLGHLRYLVEKHEKGYKENTLVTYEGALNRFGHYLSHQHSLTLTANDAPNISQDILEGYLHHLLVMRRAASTVNIYVTIIRKFFAYLAAKKIISSDPSRILYYVVESESDDMPPDEADKFYTEEQLSLLYDYYEANKTISNLRDRAMIAIILSNGLRISEVCGLDIWQYHQIIRQGCTKVRRGKKRGGREWARVEFGQFAIDAINDYLTVRGAADKREPLFITSHGKRIDRKTAWARFHKAQEAVGIQSGTHTFRHTAITHVAYEHGEEEASRFSGHERRETTKIYLHDIRSVARETANTLADVWTSQAE